MRGGQPATVSLPPCVRSATPRLSGVWSPVFSVACSWCAGGCRTGAGSRVDHDARPARRPAPTAVGPCAPTIQEPSSELPGSYVVRDHFESGTLSKWTSRTRGTRGPASRTVCAARGLCAGRLIVSSSSTSGRTSVRRSRRGRPTPGRSAGSGSAPRAMPAATYRCSASSMVPSGSSTSTARTAQGDLWLRTADGHGSWRYVRLNRMVSLNSWHRVIVHVHAGWSAGRVDVYIDGACGSGTVRTTFRPAESRPSWLARSTSARRWT